MRVSEDQSARQWHMGVALVLSIGRVEEGAFGKGRCHWNRLYVHDVMGFNREGIPLHWVIHWVEDRKAFSRLPD